MPKTQNNTGPLHTLSKDMKDVLNKREELLEKWDSLTPLAKNEWICWTTIVKRQETREKHLVRFKGADTSPP